MTFNTSSRHSLRFGVRSLAVGVGALLRRNRDGLEVDLVPPKHGPQNARNRATDVVRVAAVSMQARRDLMCSGPRCAQRSLPPTGERYQLTRCKFPLDFNNVVR